MNLVKRQIDDVVVDLGTTRALMHVCCLIPEKPHATIFFIPGFCGIHSDYNEIANFLASRGYLTVQFDMFGRGKSARLRADQYTLHNYLNALYQLMNVYKKGRAVIAGSGWGGAIGAALCLSMNVEKPLLIVSDLSPLWTIDNDIDVAYADLIINYPSLSKEDLINRLSARFHEIEFDTKYLARYLTNKLSEDGKYNVCDENCLLSLSSYQGQTFDFLEIMKNLSDVLILGTCKDDWHSIFKAQEAANIFHIINSRGERRITFSGYEDNIAILGFLNTHLKWI